MVQRTMQNVPYDSFQARSQGKPKHFSMRIFVCTIFTFTSLLSSVVGAFAAAQNSSGEDLWRGLVVAPEHRCSKYQSDYYPYPHSVETDIAVELGGFWSPYTEECFRNLCATDIEHIVAKSEAHDSGLCGASAEVRERFSQDTLNLTLADPKTNRKEKRDKDAREWIPERNPCWFAARVIEVRRKYDLTIDREEVNALEGILSRCDPAQVSLSVSLPTSCHAAITTLKGRDEALLRWDDNGNACITCAEARRHGIAPVSRSHPAYPWMRDADGDGTVCE